MPSGRRIRELALRWIATGAMRGRLPPHNPVIYKARNIGNWLVNGEAPTFIWQIGNGEKTAG